jgi:hypothetical protein
MSFAPGVGLMLAPKLATVNGRTMGDKPTSKVALSATVG